MLTNRPIRFLLFLFVLASLIFLPVASLLAHSGRTDKYGGHWDRKTGTYHYHSFRGSPVPRQTPPSPNTSSGEDLPLREGIIQSIIIDTEGKADISLAFRFTVGNLPAQTQVLIQELGYLFHELQENYAFTSAKEGDYLTYIFNRLGKVDIGQTKYMTFSKREDATYSFTLTIPPVTSLTGYFYQSPVLIIKVTLPKEIDIANTMDYQGNTAVWTINQTDLKERGKILKAYTKP